jgi:hypothetical protein
MSQADKPAAYSPMVRPENSPPDCFPILLTVIHAVDPGLALLDHLRLKTAIHCPAVVCLQTMSIRIGQAGFSFHFRPSRSNAFAMTMSLRMTAVMASFLHFPVDINCSYLTFRSGLNRFATTAGK